MAVSGGADSFSLLHVLHEKKVPLTCLTLDHGLRPEAVDEAAKVAEWCAARDITHEILVWDHAPKSGVQAAARAARYRLLCEACNRLGIETLVTGHTADDQAETIFMRLRRGSGRGLAGMPATRLIASGAGAPVTLYRPLLDVRRRDTLAHAKAHDLPISDDPSNQDATYERVRVRALLAALEQQDILTVEALCKTAAEVAVALPDPFHAVRDVAFHADGSLTLRNDDHENMALTAIGGEVRPSLRRDGEVRSGCLLRDHDQAGRLIFREPAALLGRADGAGGFKPITVKPGESYLYDRRFIVHVPEKIDDATVLRPLGALLPRDIATSTLDRQRLSTLPCLSRQEALTHLPETCGDFITQALGGWKQADAFLNGVDRFVTDSLLEERFTGHVIRF